MKKSYYIKERRVGLQLMHTIVIYLLLDKFHAAQWVWGAVGVFYLIIWIICIIMIFYQTGVSVLDENGKIKK